MQTINIFFYIFLLILNFFLFFYNKRISEILNILDIPDNKRKLHKLPASLSGGLFLYCNIIFLFFFSFYFNNKLIDFFFIKSNLDFIFFILILTSFFICGFVDDKIKLRSSTKLILIIFTCYLLISSFDELLISELKTDFFSKKILSPKASTLFSILGLVTLIVILNLYDGLNLQSVIYYFLIFVYFFLKLPSMLDLTLLVTLLIFFTFFSYYNYKGRVFIGESGVMLISLILFFCCVNLYKSSDAIVLQELILLFFLPLVDAVRLFFKRTLNNQSPLEGDLNHLHHKLLLSFNYNKTIMILFLFQFLTIISIIFFKNYNSILIVNILFYIFLLFKKKK
jgi:UDP-GlcNAc:undecaprenyl-phosphate GlcNAc-1-phosphate transferase